MTFRYDEDRDSLTDILRECGYTHRKCATTVGTRPARDILNAAGERVFSGTYGQTLEWLIESGQVEKLEKGA